jgi:putative transposase
MGNGELVMGNFSSVPLQQSLKQLEAAYKNYFDFLKGKRKGRKVGQPKFKKRINSQSATFVKSGFSVKGESVYLAKIGNVNPMHSSF